MRAQHGLTWICACLTKAEVVSTPCFCSDLFLQLGGTRSQRRLKKGYFEYWKSKMSGSRKAIHLGIVNLSKRGKTASSFLLVTKKSLFKHLGWQESRLDAAICQLRSFYKRSQDSSDRKDNRPADPPSTIPPLSPARCAPTPAEGLSTWQGSCGKPCPPAHTECTRPDSRNPVRTPSWVYHPDTPWIITRSVPPTLSDDISAISHCWHHFWRLWRHSDWEFKCRLLYESVVGVWVKEAGRISWGDKPLICVSFLYSTL